jgi:integrase
MASIENKSRTQVTVKNRDDLTKHFPYNKSQAAYDYIQSLKAQGLKPIAKVLDEAYLVRYKVNGKRRSFTYPSADEALAAQKRIESEQEHGLFIDHTKGHRVSFADVLVRYLHEEAPKNKGYVITAYTINSWLRDADLPTHDMAAVYAKHPARFDPGLKIPSQTGKRMSAPSEKVAFIRKGFATLEPEDFRDFINERLLEVMPATADREFDLMRVVCNFGIDFCRIPVPIHPMKGVKAPRYWNERDRRLRGDEEQRLMAAAEEEDRKASIALRVEELLASKHCQKTETKYRRLQLLKVVQAEAEATYVHVPLFATFIQFQLLTGARKSEALNAKWSEADLEGMTIFVPESKNGRPRDLILRTAIIRLLEQVPRSGELIFPIHEARLRKAWTRIRIAAGVPTEGDDALHIHDLRHEAISRVAEAGSNTPGGFTLMDLQRFSGHRDLRMMMRYSNLLPKGLALKLDAAFENKELHTTYKGRKRLTSKAEIELRVVMTTPLGNEEEAPEAAPCIEKSNVVTVDFKKLANARQ